MDLNDIEFSPLKDCLGDDIKENIEKLFNITDIKFNNPLLDYFMRLKNDNEALNNYLEINNKFNSKHSSSKFNRKHKNKNKYKINSLGLELDSSDRDSRG